MILQAGSMRAFGNGSELDEIPTFDTSVSAQIVTFPLSEIVPNGLRLGRDSKDVLRATVKDDLTGLSSFTVNCLGYRHFPFVK